jgi:hypothetical protein
MNGDLSQLFGARFSDEVLLKIASEQLLEAHIQRGKQLKLYPEDYNQLLEGRSASKQILERWRLLRKGCTNEKKITKKEKKTRKSTDQTDTMKNDEVDDEEEDNDDDDHHLDGRHVDNDVVDEDEEDNEQQQTSRLTSHRGKKRIRVDDDVQLQQFRDVKELSTVVTSTSRTTTTTTIITGQAEAEATVSSSTTILTDDQNLSFSTSSSSSSSASASLPVLPPILSPNVHSMTPTAPSLIPSTNHVSSSSHSPPAHRINSNSTPSINNSASGGNLINLDDEHHYSSRLSEEKELETWARKVLLPDLLEIQSIVRDAKIRQAANSSYAAAVASTSLASSLQQQSQSQTQQQLQQSGGSISGGALTLGIGNNSPFSSPPSISHSFDIYEVLSKREGRLGHILSSHNDPRFIDPKTSIPRNRDPFYKTVNAWHRARLHEIVDAPGIHGGIKKTLRWWGIKDKAVYPPGYSTLAAEAEERAMYQAAAEAERRRKIEEEILKEKIRLEALRAEKRLQEELAAKKERAEKDRIEFEKRAAFRERAEYEDRMYRERQEYEFEQRRLESNIRYGGGEVDRGGGVGGGRDSFASHRPSPPISREFHRDEGQYGGRGGGGAGRGGRWGGPPSVPPPMPPFRGGLTAPPPPSAPLSGGAIGPDFSRRRDVIEAPLRRMVDEDFARRREDRPLLPSSHSLHLSAPTMTNGVGGSSGSILGRPGSLSSQDAVNREVGGGGGGGHAAMPLSMDRPVSLLGGSTQRQFDSSFNQNRVVGRFDRSPPPPPPPPPLPPHLALPGSRNSNREEGGGGGFNNHRNGKGLIGDRDAFVNGRGGWR